MTLAAEARRLAAGLAAVLGAAASTSPAPCQTPSGAGPPQTAWVLVIDDRLEAWAGALTSVGDGAVAIADAERQRTFAPGEWVGLYAASPAADPMLGVGGAAPDGRADGVSVERLSRRLAPSLGVPGDAGAGPLGVVVTTDGQWIPGVLGEDASARGDDALRWAHPDLGELSLQLDRVVAVAMPGGPPAASLIEQADDLRQDVLLLANDDRITGFAEQIASTVRFDAGAGEVAIGADLVGGVLLANPTTERDGAFLWLDDGAILRLDDADIGPGGGTLRIPLGDAGPAQAAARARDVSALTPDARRLTPLASLAPSSQTPIGEGRSTIPIERRGHPMDVGLASGAALGLHSLRLPGPMEVAYDLPAGSARFAATAVLEHRAGPWADCEIVVLTGGREAARARLHAGAPAAPINVVLDGGDLTLRVETGAHGPVQDQVILHRPMVLRRPQTE